MLTFIAPASDKPEHVAAINSRILRDAADAAMSEWLADNPELYTELSTQYDSTDEAFEFVSDAADALYSAYVLEEDQSALSAAAADHVYYNVAHEKAHRPLRQRTGAVVDDEHVRAYHRHERAVALRKGIAKRTKARRYHDIHELVFGRNGKLLGASRVAIAQRKATAADFKTATASLKSSQQQKVRRYMASKGEDVVEAMDALKGAGKL